MYALYKDGKMISKPHTTEDACAAEAFNRGLIVQMSTISKAILAEGVSIGNLNPPDKPARK